MKTELQCETIERLMTLAPEFQRVKVSAEREMKEAITVAFDLGVALEAVRNTHADSFDLILAQAELSKPMASRLMHLSRSTTREAIRRGEYRQGALQLQILPPAAKKAPEEDRRLDALPHFSAIALHWKRVARLMELGQLRVDPDKVKEKTAELYAYLKGVHESI